MKKLLFVVILLAMSLVLFAEFTPYGSVKVGWWFKNEDGDRSDWDNGRWNLNHLHLQTNAHLGIDFLKGDLTGKGEFNFDTGEGKVTPAYLWGKYNFGKFSLLVGYDGDGFADFYADQVMFDDAGLLGYGVLDTGTNPTIRVEMENGLYFALIDPYFAYAEETYVDTLNVEKKFSDLVDHHFPKINLGMRLELMDGDMLIHPSLLFQMYQYNEDIADYNESLTSFMFGLEYRWQINEKMKLGVAGYYGRNVFDLGATGSATWEDKYYYAPIEELSASPDTYTVRDVDSMGGYLSFEVALNDDTEIAFGIGYAQDDGYLRDPETDEVKKFETPDNRLGLYLQPRFKIGELNLIPEVGYLMEMDGPFKEKEGNAMYLGFQLRYDF